MSHALSNYRELWERKPVLRLIYDDFYERIVAQCVHGLTIEIGGGIGNLKRRLPDVITTDIQFAPWLDCIADAQHLPFLGDAVANIVMVDVLHHLEYPVHFFREAIRVLRVGGRIIMIEPAITPGSALFYRLLHHEPVLMTADPLADGTPDPQRDPYAANQALPTLLATRDRARFERLFPQLKICSIEWFSLFTYPLSGGFKRWTLIPQTLAPLAFRLERALESAIGRFGAFRMTLVIEKTR